MRFATFLKVPIGGLTPIQRVKFEFENYKQLFNFADKTTDIYNNLIDNIFWLLNTKFGNREMLYRSANTCYNELSLILSTQIPQFMMVQKKQLLESLETFSNINNWGVVIKDQVKRNIIGTNNDESTTNFIPLDGSTLDPYSKNNNVNNNTSNEASDVNRQTSDFLTFFSRIRWNTANIELNSILKPYESLFISMYVPAEQIGNDPVVPDNPLEELEQRVEDLEQFQGEIVTDISEIRQTNIQQDGKINTNTQNITNNTQSINNLTQVVSNKLDRDTADRLYLTETRGNELYFRKSDSSGLLTKEEAARTYLTQLNASNTYVTKSLANSTYATKSDLNTTNSNITSLNNRITQVDTNRRIKWLEIRGSDFTLKEGRVSIGTASQYYYYCVYPIQDNKGLQFNRYVNAFVVSNSSEIAPALYHASTYIKDGKFYLIIGAGSTAPIYSMNLFKQSCSVRVLYAIENMSS